VTACNPASIVPIRYTTLAKIAFSLALSFKIPCGQQWDSFLQECICGVFWLSCVRHSFDRFASATRDVFDASFLLPMRSLNDNYFVHEQRIDQAWLMDGEVPYVTSTETLILPSGADLYQIAHVSMVSSGHLRRQSPGNGWTLVDRSSDEPPRASRLSAASLFFYLREDCFLRHHPGRDPLEVLRPYPQTPRSWILTLDTQGLSQRDT